MSHNHSLIINNVTLTKIVFTVFHNRASGEIFNPRNRIVLDSLMFISVAAARRPWPPGELNLRAPGVLLPAYQCQRRASEYANAREEKSTAEAMICLQLAQYFTSVYSDFLFSILFCNTLFYNCSIFTYSIRLLGLLVASVK